VVSVAGSAQQLRLSGTKRDEPQGRQRDATSPRAGCGANRRGGAKPRGRNMTSGLASRGRRMGRQLPVREWTQPVTARAGPARDGRRRGDLGRGAGASRIPSVRTPGEESGVSRTGRWTSAPKWSRDEGRWPIRSDAGRQRCFAEDLEGPFRPGNRVESKAREDAVNAKAAATPHTSQGGHR